jgi:hypothetical protein
MGVNRQDVDKTIQPSTVLMFGRALEQRSEDEVRAALQAVLEGKSLGQSSLDDKLVHEFEGVLFSRRQLHEDRLCVKLFDGTIQTLRRHCNGGGWVPLVQDASRGPFVADSAYVGPYAMVYGNACVRDRAELWQNARVFENARVFDEARMANSVRVYGKAAVFGKADLYGDVHVRGSSQVFGNDILREGAYATYRTT